MLSWLNAWILSHTDTRFYRHVDQYKGRFLRLYLLSIYLTLAALSTALFAFRTLPTWTTDSTELWSDLEKNWPENVKLSLQNNRLQLEGVEELVLPIPEHLANRYNLPSNFLFVSEQLQTASQSATPAAFILTSDTVNIWNPDGSYRSDLWSNLQPEEMNWEKASFSDNVEFFVQMKEFSSWALIIGMFFLSWIGLLALRVLALVFYSWVGQSLLLLSGNRLKYGTTFKIGLFLLPITEEILLLERIISPSSSFLSFWLVWLLLFAAVAFTNQRVLESDK